MSDQSSSIKPAGLPDGPVAGLFPLCKNVGMHPKSSGILESSLYVQDVPASAQFYARIFGFRMVSDFGERGCAMQAGERQVLLLFKKGGSLRIPSPHDGA